MIAVGLLRRKRAERYMKYSLCLSYGGIHGYEKRGKCKYSIS